MWNGKVLSSEEFFRRLDNEKSSLASTSFKTLAGDIGEIQKLVSKHKYEFDQTVYSHESQLLSTITINPNDPNDRSTVKKAIVKYSEAPDTDLESVKNALAKISPSKEKGQLVHDACFIDMNKELFTFLNRRWAVNSSADDNVHYGYKIVDPQEKTCLVYFDTLVYYTIQTSGDPPPTMEIGFME